jgi:hypothetical protein
MNRQRIRNITFAQICQRCGYTAIGRQLGRTTTYEGGLNDQPDHCPVMKKEFMAECIDWRNAKVVEKAAEE